MRIRRRFFIAVATLAGLITGRCTVAEDSGKPSNPKNPVVVISTSMGEIEVELYEDKAPKTVANFLAYVKEGFYDGTVFHRVIPNFMIQGGGMTADLKEKATRSPIRNEANNGVKNETGTLAMARTSAPHSASAQWFINVRDNDFLDHRSETTEGWGYAVFGKVIDGMDVVRKIERVETTRKGPHDDVPAKPVVIESIKTASPTK